MCLIIASPNGKRTAENVLRHAFAANPHGWGVMYSNGNSIQVEKGMRLEPFLSACERAHGLPHVIHLRYATHGPKNRMNTHPFKIQEGLWMCHNGILNIHCADKSRSDTWHYAQFLTSILAEYPSFYESEDFIKEVGEDIGKGNKFAFLENYGNIKIVNESSGFWHDEQWYSNDYSLPTWFGFETPFDEELEDWDVTFEAEDEMTRYSSHWDELELEYSRHLASETGDPEELQVPSRHRVYARW